MNRKKSGTPPPTANAVNPYMIARKTAMMQSKIRPIDVYSIVSDKVSDATVREVINGTFRNDDVMEALSRLTDVAKGVLFPSEELKWLAAQREARERALEAAS